MAIKKKSRVSAQFNMSSLTDIIFLLLIFFMLTSSLVSPNALNLQLPGQKSSTPPSNAKITNVRIEANGSYFYNNKSITLSGLENQLTMFKRAEGRGANITISPHSNSSNESVVKVLDICYRHAIGTVMTEPR